MRWIAALLVSLLSITPSEAQDLSKRDAYAMWMRAGHADYEIGDLSAAQTAYTQAFALRATCEASLGLAQVACAAHNYERCRLHARAALDGPTEPLPESGRSRAEWLIGETLRIASLAQEGAGASELARPRHPAQPKECDARTPSQNRLWWVGASLLVVGAFTAALVIASEP